MGLNGFGLYVFFLSGLILVAVSRFISFGENISKGRV
jgi:hypothetical protein